MRPYRGRFAPTPSGPLHAGSIVAALASWLDARAHGGQWLVRIEDTDTPRCVPGADRFILQQLHGLGLVPDEAARWQSKRVIHYEAALQHLRAQGLAYGCACSRQDIERAQASQGAARGRHSTAVYPGTCRLGTKGRPSRAWRVRIDDPLAKACSAWHDRRLGSQHHELSTEVGDFVVRRADGLWAYQLAVVVDDADQGITDVVRGEDLADNTPRQRYLQTLLGLPAPRYLHTALVRAADGQKLSKQTGAQAISTDQPLRVLQDAAKVLELPLQPLSSIVSSPTPRSTQIAGLPDADVQRALVGRWLEHATQAWARRWLPDHGGRRPSS